jgi:hypothetical protein
MTPNKVVNIVRFAHWDAQQATRLLPQRYGALNKENQVWQNVNSIPKQKLSVKSI